MSDLKLTAEEERLILRLRAAEERERRDRALALRRIKAAYDFAQWMETEGHGPSYSTFCDDFGYEAGPDEPRPRTYVSPRRAGGWGCRKFQIGQIVRFPQAGRGLGNFVYLITIIR